MKFIVRQPESRGEIVYFTEDNIGYLELCNSRARNAMSLNMMIDLSDVLSQIEEQPPSILVVRGNDKQYFCSGGDLRDVRQFISTPEAGAEMCQYMREKLSLLASLPTFIVVVIDGAAIGGGAELAMIGDYIIASTDSTIGFVQSSLGVTTGWGGAERLIRRIGRVRAIQVLTLAQRHSASEALAIGLVDEVTQDVDVNLEQLITLLQKRPERTRKVLLTMMKGRIDEQNAFEQTWASPDHLSALGLSQERKV